MLEKVRRSMQSGFTYVLVAALIVIFMFFFGMPSQTCSGAAGRSRALLADVAGESIYTDDVDVVYNRVFGTDQPDEDSVYRKRRALALRNLVLIELFAQRARNQGYRVSTEQLKNFITSAARNPEYRSRYGAQGSFNGKYYEAYVKNQLQLRIETYETFKREELLARRYLASLATQATVPTAQLESTRAIRETKMNLAFVGLDEKKLREFVDVGTADIQSFLESNRKKVKSYYENNKSSKYTEPEKVRIRRVYIVRPGDSAKKQERQKARQKWKEAKNRVLKQDESVAKVAADLGESYPGQKKGLMDWSTLDNISKELKNAVKGAEVGSVKKVETDHAYMLVKLEGRRDKKVTPLADVEQTIAERLLQKQRVGSLVEDVRKKLLAEANETGSLEKALENLASSSDREIWSGLSVEETGDFTLKSKGPPPQLAAQMKGQMPANLGGSWYEIPKIGEIKKLAIDAYKNLTTDDPVPDQVYEAGGTKYIVRLKSRTAPGASSEETKENGGDDSDGKEVESALENQKLVQLVGDWTRVFGDWGLALSRIAKMRPDLAGRMAPPKEKYGAWIDRQLETAVDEGTVTIYGDRSKVASRLEQSLQPGGSIDGAAKKKKKKKGKPLQINMGGGNKGKGKKQKINLQKLKKKMQRQLQKKKKGSKPGGTGGPGSGADESIQKEPSEGNDE